MTKHVAVYIRVSSKKQDTRSQEPDLKRWAEAYADGQQVRWYRDKSSGRSMERPGWRNWKQIYVGEKLPSWSSGAWIGWEELPVASRRCLKSCNSGRSI